MPEVMPTTNFDTASPRCRVQVAMTGIAKIDGSTGTGMKNPLRTFTQRTHPLNQIGVNHGIKLKMLFFFQRLNLTAVNHAADVQDVVVIKEIGRASGRESVEI